MIGMVRLKERKSEINHSRVIAGHSKTNFFQEESQNGDCFITTLEKGIILQFLYQTSLVSPQI